MVIKLSSVGEGGGGEAYYNNFILSMKSEATKQLYTYCLNRYMQYCHYLSIEDLLVKGGKEPRLIEASIIQYIVWLKQDQKLSSISVEHYLSAVMHFYSMNENGKDCKMGSLNICCCVTSDWYFYICV